MQFGVTSHNSEPMDCSWHLFSKTHSVPMEQTRLVRKRGGAGRSVLFLCLIATMGVLSMAILLCDTRRERMSQGKHGLMRRGWPLRFGSASLREMLFGWASTEAHDMHFCVGYAAVGKYRSLAAVDVGPTWEYAERHGYTPLVLEAEDMDSLQNRYCPELASELSIAETTIALKYCTVWYALEHENCDYVAWVDAGATILYENIQLHQIVQRGIDAIWFETGQVVPTTDTCHNHLDGLDSSQFILGNTAKDGWFQAFVHLKLAFSSMPTYFLERSDCKCDTTRDECTTRCLYKHHPDWLDKARCIRLGSVSVRDHMQFGDLNPDKLPWRHTAI